MNDQKPRILVVDDEKFNRTVLLNLLKKEYTVILAKDGDGALKKAHSQYPPDLILLDILMPGMDGYTVCRKLKDAPATHDIPVIFVTAMQQEEDEQKGLDIGAIDYIAKPFRPSIVRARIRNHIVLAQVRQKLAQAHHMLAMKNRELEIMASRDALTKLYNRLYLDEMMTQEIKKSKRYQRPFSIILLDIDHFKQVNDTYGHQTGDMVLQRLAELLRENSRESDILFRFGGEEFLIICPETNPQKIIFIAEKLRQIVEQRRFPTVENITASFGHTSYIEGDTLEKLIERADTALYKAKELGRNQIHPKEIKMEPIDKNHYRSNEFQGNQL